MLYPSLVLTLTLVLVLVLALALLAAVCLSEKNQRHLLPLFVQASTFDQVTTLDQATTPDHGGAFGGGG